LGGPKGAELKPPRRSIPSWGLSTLWSWSSLSLRFPAVIAERRSIMKKMAFVELGVTLIFAVAWSSEGLCQCAPGIGAKP